MGLFAALVLEAGSALAALRVSAPRSSARTAAALRISHAAGLALLLLLVLSGASLVTDLKAGAGSRYFEDFGPRLTKKLVAGFGLVNLVSWNAFGPGMKLVRMSTGVIPWDGGRFRSNAIRSALVALASLVLALYAASFFSFR